MNKENKKIIINVIGEKSYNDFRCLKGNVKSIAKEIRLARDSKDRNFISLWA